jgi:hypothetical protein
MASMSENIFQFMRIFSKFVVAEEVLRHKCMPFFNGFELQRNRLQWRVQHI